MDIFIMIFIFIFSFFLIELYKNFAFTIKNLPLIFVVLNSFIYLLLPFLFDYYKIKLYNIEVDVYHILCVLLFLASLSIGGLGISKLYSSKVVDKRIYFAQINDVFLNRLIITYLLVVIFFAYKFLPLLISDPRAYLANRIQILKGFGYISSLASLGFPIFFILYYKIKYNFDKRKNIIKIIFIVLTLILVAMLKGSRASVIEPIILIGLSELFFAVKKIKFSTIGKTVVVVGGFISVISLLGNVRQSDNLESGEVNFKRNIEELQNNYNHFEYFQVFVNKNADYLYGKTFLAVATLPVPRAFWPDKPVGGGPYLKNVIHPGSYDLIHNENNTSLTTGLFIEAYMNFGLLGVCVIGLIYGMLLKNISISFFTQHTTVRKSIIYFFLVYILVFIIPTGEVLGAFVRVLYYVIPFLFYPKRDDKYIY